MEISRIVSIFETKGADALIRKEKEIVKQAEKIDDSLDDATQAARNFGKGAAAAGRNAERELSRAEKQAKSLKSQFSSIRGALGGLGAGISLGAGIAEFTKFESAFNNVVTLLDDASFADQPLIAGIDQLREGILDLSRASGQGLGTLNKALFDTVSAGVPAGEAIKFLGSATDLALAGGTTAAVAVDGLTTSINAFRLEASQADEVAQKFFTAQKFGKTTIEELSGSIGKVAPIADALGVSLDETLASLAALTAGGINTSEATTGLKAALSNISKPSKDAADLAKQLGLQFDFQAIKSQGLAGFLDNVVEKTGGSQEAMLKLFGSTEAVATIFALTGSQADLFQQTLGALGDKTQSAATFAEALRVKQQELGFVFAQLVRVVQTAAVTLVGQFAPALAQLSNTILQLVSGGGFTALLETIGNLISVVVIFAIAFVNGFVGAFQTASEAIAPFLAAILPTGVALGDIIDTLSRMAETFGTFVGTLAAVKLGFVALNAVLAINPFLAIATALIAVITYLVTFRNEILPISGSIASLGDIVTVVFDRIVNALNQTIQFFSQFFTGITVDASTSVNAVGQIFQLLANTMKNTANFMIGAFVSVFETLKTLFVTLPKVIGSAVVGVVNGIVSTIERMLKIVASRIDRIIGFANSAAKLFGGSGETLPTIGDVNLGRVNNSFAGAGGELASGLSNAAGALTRDYIGEAKSVVESVANGIVKEAEAGAQRRFEIEKNTAAEAAKIQNLITESQTTKAVTDGLSGDLQKKIDDLKSTLNDNKPAVAALSSGSGGGGSVGGGGGSGRRTAGISEAEKASKALEKSEVSRLDKLKNLVSGVDSDLAKLSDSPIDDYNLLLKKQAETIANAKELRADEKTIEKIKEANRAKELDFVKNLSKEDFNTLKSAVPSVGGLNIDVPEDIFKDVGKSLESALASTIGNVFQSIGNGEKIDVGGAIGGIASSVLGTVGTAIGGPIGGAIGTGIGSLIGGLFGSSDKKKEEERKRREELTKFFDQVDQQLAQLTATPLDDYELLLKSQKDSLKNARALGASAKQIGKLQRLNQLQELQFLENLTRREIDKLGDAISEKTKEFALVRIEARELIDADLELADALRDNAEDLRAFGEELRFTDFSPLKDIDKLALARTEFDDIARRAQLGDTDALQDFEAASRRLLELSREVNASNEVFANDFDTIERLSRSLSDTSVSAADRVEERAFQAQDDLDAGFDDGAAGRLQAYIEQQSKKEDRQTETLRELSGQYAESIELQRETGQLTVQLLSDILLQSTTGNDLTREEADRIATERLRGTVTNSAAA